MDAPFVALLVLAAPRPAVVAQRGAPEADAPAAFSADGRFAALLTTQSARVFDLVSRRMLVDLPVREPMAVDIDDQGRRVLTVGRDSNGPYVRVFDLDTDRAVTLGRNGRSISREVKWVSSAALSRDGKKIAVFSFPPDAGGLADTERRTLSYWSAESGAMLSSATRKAGALGYEGQFDTKGRLWVQESEHVEVCTGERCTTSPFSPVQTSSARYPWAISADGSRIAGSDRGRGFHTMFSDGRLERGLWPDFELTWQIAVNDAGTEVTLVGSNSAANERATVQVFDPESGSSKRTFTLPEGLSLPRLSRDARLLLASDREGALQLFDLTTFTPLGRVGTPSGFVRDLAFSADGRFLAVASLGAFVFDLETARIVQHSWIGLDGARDGAVDWVALTPDGRELYFRPGHTRTEERPAMRRMDVASGSWLPPNVDSECDALVFIDTRRWACELIRDGETSVALFSDGKLEKSVPKATAPRLSRDGRRLTFTHTADGGASWPAVLDLATLETRYSDVPVTCKSTCTADGRHADVLEDSYPTRVESPDGKTVALGTRDGAVELRATKGALIATLHMAPDGGHVIVLPSGYYGASRTALDRVAFRRGRKVIGFERYDLALNRPHEVMRALGRADRATTDAAERAWKRRLTKLGLDPARVEFVEQGPSVRLTGGVPSTDAEVIELTAEISAGANPLAKLLVRVDGVPEGEPRTITGRVATVPVPVRLVRGRNGVELVAIDVKGAESEAESLVVDRTTGPEQSALHVLAIGVSRYADHERDLGYAAKDARDLTERLGASARFSAHHTHVLVDADVTREGITRAAEALTGARLEDTVVVFLAGHGLLDDGEYYFGTHDLDFEHPAARGLPYAAIEDLFTRVAARRRLVFIDTCASGEVDPSTIDTSPVATVLPSGATAKVKARGFRRIPSKARPLADTVALQETMFADLRRGAGISVIASAGGLELALESQELSNGVFTHAVLEALRTKSADRDRDGAIRVSELRDTVSLRVRELTGGRQNPTARRENVEGDFILE